MENNFKITTAHNVFVDLCKDNIKDADYLGLLIKADGIMQDIISNASCVTYNNNVVSCYNDIRSLYNNLTSILELEDELPEETKERLVIRSNGSPVYYREKTIYEMLDEAILYIDFKKIRVLPKFTYELREDPKPITFDTCNTVRLSDYSDYKSDKCNNGGCYGFWTDYSRLENGKWELSFHTTADFDYCPCCGSFNDHHVWSDEDDIYDSGFSCGKFETISTEELVNIINEFEKQHGNDDNYSIEYLLSNNNDNNNVISDDDDIIII